MFIQLVAAVRNKKWKGIPPFNSLGWLCPFTCRFFSASMHAKTWFISLNDIRLSGIPFTMQLHIKKAQIPYFFTFHFQSNHRTHKMYYLLLFIFNDTFPPLRRSCSNLWSLYEWLVVWMKFTMDLAFVGTAVCRFGCIRVSEWERERWPEEANSLWCEFNPKETRARCWKHLIMEIIWDLRWI